MVFREITRAGLSGGFDHPIDWALNYTSVPLAANTVEGNLHYYLARFLCDIFECDYSGYPDEPEDVLKWCDDHYPDQHIAKGFFGFLTEQLRYCIEHRD